MVIIFIFKGEIIDGVFEFMCLFMRVEYTLDDLKDLLKYGTISVS